MRKFLSVAFLLAAGALTVTPAEAAKICISTRDIVDSQSQKDGKAIFFRMRDGTVWRNDLQGACPDLRFEGFVWWVLNPDETVCESVQSLRVLQSGQICVLGKFTQVTPPNKPM